MRKRFNVMCLLLITIVSSTASQLKKLWLSASSPQWACKEDQRLIGVACFLTRSYLNAAVVKWNLKVDRVLEAIFFLHLGDN